jgi:hypothetical protein
MTGIQILAVLFAFFALSRVLIRFKEAKINTKEFLLWSIVWIAVIFVAVLPWTTSLAANLIGIERGIDLVVYISIVVLFYLMFRTYVKMENVEREITRLVREEAIGKRKR